MLRADRLLSLVTFFAAAKKVTAAPHRGRPINRTQDKLHGKAIRPTAFKPPQTTEQRKQLPPRTGAAMQITKGTARASAPANLDQATLFT
jgi:hypothetical protein